MILIINNFLKGTFFFVIILFCGRVTADLIVSDFSKFLFDSNALEVSENLSALLSTSHTDQNQLHFSFEEKLENTFEKIGSPPEIILNGVVGKAALFTSASSSLKYQKGMPRFFNATGSVPSFTISFYIFPVKLLGVQTLFRNFLDRKTGATDGINSLHLFLDGPFLVLEIEENLLKDRKSIRKKSLSMVQMNLWQKIAISYNKQEKIFFLYLDEKEVASMNTYLQWVIGKDDISTVYLGGGFTGALDEFYFMPYHSKKNRAGGGQDRKGVYVSKVIPLRRKDVVISRVKLSSQRIDLRKIKIFLRKSSFIFEESDENMGWPLLTSSGVIEDISRNPDRFFQFRIDLSSIGPKEELFRITSIHFEMVPKTIASPEIFRIFPKVGSARVIWKNPLDPLVKKIWFYISKDGFRRHLIKFGGFIDDFDRDEDGNVSAIIGGLVEGQEYQIFARFQGNLADHLSGPSQSMVIIPEREEPTP